MRLCGQTLIVISATRDSHATRYKKWHGGTQFKNRLGGQNASN
jgi:hypothetical protein